MQYRCSRVFTQIKRCLQVIECTIVQVLSLSFLEFDQKRKKAVSTNEDLQKDAQAVLNVIENPDVAQALRQDKNQNLQYLKENYNVRRPPIPRCPFSE